MVQYVMPAGVHNDLVVAAYRARGYEDDEARAAARCAESAARHGVHTHNALKAISLDDHFGSKAGGCRPGARIEKLTPRFKTVHRWNANRKLGQAVAYEAMDVAMKLADEYGVGAVAVDNAFHYLWGGGYVIEAARKGYIAYTCCTAATAEVVPFGGRFPTLGTNPHSWGFPTQDAVGFPVCIDWATSVVAMGRVQQYQREGRLLPGGCAVDADGKETRDPARVAALLPFGGHKGYGLALIDELLAGYVGGSLPTLRSRWGVGPEGEKRTPVFFFQCMRPESLGCDGFAMGRTQTQNVKAILEDIRGHGNEACLLPGEPEARAAALSDRHGGLLFTEAEIAAFARMASEVGVALDGSSLNRVDV
jgi:L-2-hydroxycarboxylate dehydrogenase (NAD+)